MAKFKIQISTSAMAEFVVEAENEDAAYENGEEMIQSEDFFKKYRESCDFCSPVVETAIKLRCWRE